MLYPTVNNNSNANFYKKYIIIKFIYLIQMYCNYPTYDYKLKYVNFSSQ